MALPTLDEKRELLKRCRALALAHGEAISYYPKRLMYAPWPELQIHYSESSDHLLVMVQNTDGRWSEMVSVLDRDANWGLGLHVCETLIKLRQHMVLDELSDA